MNKILTLAVVLFTITGAVSAQNASSLEQARNYYNQREIPEFLANIVGDERINIKINNSGEIREIGVVMDGITAKKVQEGGIENATITAYVKAETLKNIASSEKPIQEAVEAVKSDKIEYRANTTAGKIKLGVLDLFTSILNVVLG